MNQNNQTQQNLNQQNQNPIRGKESFDKNQQNQKFGSGNANEKAKESYVPHQQNEEEQMDSDSVSE